ncbi:hypothetical protein VVS316_01492 [Vibrio vulnificus]|nr:hypothetical protein VVS316_01492 [Vibrio vulnificus]
MARVWQREYRQIDVFFGDINWHGLQRIQQSAAITGGRAIPIVEQIEFKNVELLIMIACQCGKLRIRFGALLGIEINKVAAIIEEDFKIGLPHIIFSEVEKHSDRDKQPNHQLQIETSEHRTAH